MISISLCMIVKNEEEVLARCIDSVKDIVDEIIIVDTGSEDKTKEIASLYTNKVFDFQWKDDFSLARNYSFSKAKKDYILWLDADDIILEDDRIKLMELKESIDPDVDIVMMRYNVGFDESGNITMSYFRERLLKRIKNYIWKYPVHEYIELSGKVINSDISICHRKNKPNTDRNLKILKKIVSRHRNISPRNLYYYAKELYYNNKFEDAIKYYKKFFECETDWIDENISACYELAKCYKYTEDRGRELRALLKSFKYDLPRAEICCELGYFYKDKKEFNKAIFWFDTALRSNKINEVWSLVMHDYWGYIPSIELSVCYYQIGNVSMAIEYNNLASTYKPQDTAVLYNREFYEKYSKTEDDSKEF